MKLKEYFKSENIELRLVQSRIVDKYLQKNHYLRSTPAGAKYRFMIVQLDSFGLNRKTLGAAMFGHPTARLEDQVKTLELTRFHLSDELPKNSESYFLARMLKIVHSFGYHRIISYADPGENHQGTIYRAVGFKEINSSTYVKTWNNRQGRSAGIQNPKLKFELLLEPFNGSEGAY